MGQQTVTGKLVDGFEYQGQTHFDFEMGKVKTAGDMFNAEIESGGVYNHLAFNGALMATQLLSIGSCTGPFTLEQVKKLSPADFNTLRAAQNQLNEGEEDPNGQSTSKESGD